MLGLVCKLESYNYKESRRSTTLPDNCLHICHSASHSPVLFEPIAQPLHALTQTINGSIEGTASMFINSVEFTLHEAYVLQASQSR